MISFRICPSACLGTWLCLLPMLLVNSLWADDASSLTVKRGLTARLQFSHPSPTLQAIPDQSMDAEVLVRLERTGQVENEFRYTLSFFGTVAGNYDLSDFIVQSDGLPLPANETLPAMMASIVSDLPPGRGSNLYEIDDPTVKAPGGYRATLFAFAVLWAAVPVVWCFVKWRARRPEQQIPDVSPPTLSDHLRPLVQLASEGRLSVEEQSRLEMLIYVFWQRRLRLPESLVDALPVMRRHAEAGGLLRSMEAWIHDGKSSEAKLDPSTMDALLAPYHASHIDDVTSPKPDVVGATA